MKKTTLRFLGLSRLWCKKSGDWNSYRILFSKFKVLFLFECDPHEGNQTCSYGETSFQKSSRINFNNKFREILDYRNFDARIRINNFSIESSSTRVKDPIETLIDEIKPIVAEISKTIYINKFGNLQNSRTIGIVTQDTKPLVFQGSTLLQVDWFWLRPEWKKWALYS